jgi:hypothetical protein
MNFIFNQHRNPKVWQEVAPGEWHRQPGYELGQAQVKNQNASDENYLDFQSHARLNMNMPDAYLTIGKGYP